MNYFALFYDVVDDFASRRSPYREEHLRLAREAHGRGELLLAGAMADPADRALLVFRAPERSVVEAFARNDPYVIQGLVTRWEVRSWNVVIGNEPADPNPRGCNTITRIWSAQTTPAQAPAYVDHLKGQVLPTLRTLDGFAGVLLLQRAAAGAVEIIVITFWESLEAIRGFAGPDLEAAVVADEAAALLTHFDRQVRHYEVIVKEDMQDTQGGK